MHRSPIEFKELSQREIVALWACMEIAIDNQKAMDRKAKSKSRRKR